MSDQPQEQDQAQELFWKHIDATEQENMCIETNAHETPVGVLVIVQVVVTNEEKEAIAMSANTEFLPGAKLVERDGAYKIVKA